MKMLTVLLGLVFSFAVFSQVSDQTIPEIIEGNYNAAAISSYDAHMETADRLLNYGRSEEAIVYYQKAVSVVTKQNKIRAYMQLVENYFRLGLEWDSQSWHRKASMYLFDNPSFRDDTENYLFFLYYKVILSNDVSSNILTDEEIDLLKTDDLYGQLIEHDFKRNILSGQYADAFKIYDHEDKEYFPMTYQIYYDLSRFLANKGNIQNLLCSTTLHKSILYKDYNSSFNFCYVLERYLVTKKRDQQNMDNLKNMISKEDPKMMYLYDVFNNSI